MNSRLGKWLNKLLRRENNMSCDCNPFRRMIEANFAKEKKRKEGKLDPEKEYGKKLLEREKAKRENEKVLQ